MLHISIFFQRERLKLSPQYVKKHRRVAYQNEKINLSRVLHEQVKLQSDMIRESVLIIDRYESLLHK